MTHITIADGEELLRAEQVLLEIQWAGEWEAGWLPKDGLHI